MCDKMADITESFYQINAQTAGTESPLRWHFALVHKFIVAVLQYNNLFYSFAITH